MKYVNSYKIFENDQYIKEELETLYKLSILTGEIPLVEEFLKRGVDINSYEDCLNESIYYDSTDFFRFLLKNGADVNNLIDTWNSNKYLRTVEIQKVLIDFELEGYLEDNKIPINPGLKDEEEKYADVYNMSVDKERFGL